MPRSIVLASLLATAAIAPVAAQSVLTAPSAAAASRSMGTDPGQGASSGGALTGVSARFSELMPARAKTFIRASSDPDERPYPQSPAGGNDDGFSGMNDVEAYEDVVAGQTVKVLVDHAGRPGYMSLFFRNFWAGAFGEPVLDWRDGNRTQILVDGRVRHDMPLTDYFRNVDDPAGQVPPFTGPFTGNRAGAHLTHTPIRFGDALKVRVFQDAFGNAARFHKVAGALASPENRLEAPRLDAWEQVFEQRGHWPHEVPRVPRARRFVLAADGGRAAFQLTGPSTILEMRATLADPENWDGLWIRAFWDGDPNASVEIPLRFLGARMQNRFGQPGMKHVLFGHDGADTIWNHMPMHFASAARIEFENRNPRPVDLRFVWSMHDGPHGGTWGHFHAYHDFGVTPTGAPFQGPKIEHRRGMLRGLFLEDGLDSTGRIPNTPGTINTHLEGDLCIRINGNRGDDHVFAATETSVGKWGWYSTPSDVPFAQDTSFSTGNKIAVRNFIGYQRRMQGSLFVFDPVHFVDGIDITLEHGPDNSANAEYELVSFLYLEPDGPARRQFFELDVGDAADEQAAGVTFGTAPRFAQSLTAPFFRDRFFNSSMVTDDGRELRDWYRFRATVPPGAAAHGVCVGFRLDRPKVRGGDVCRAEIWVNGAYAGLLNSYTSNTLKRWKEGGELEVEIPLRLTDGVSRLDIEVRHVASSDPLRVGRIWLYGYDKP